jgi:hypothetical protein
MKRTDDKKRRPTPIESSIATHHNVQKTPTLERQQWSGGYKKNPLHTRKKHKTNNTT